MGAADSVPGVSGGTVALITNIYDELVDAIKSIGWNVLLVWKKEGFGAAWNKINGSFLLTLFLGILSSLFLLGNIILSVMVNYLPHLLAFFAGLVLASIYFVGKQISRWNLARSLLFLAGLMLALLLANLPLAEANNTLLYFFFSGAIAICAMILPGISGAFILVLLGVYGEVLEALTGLNWLVITVFASGCLCGLMLFSRLLSWLLHSHHDLTHAGLTGLLAGSLYLLWPWRIPLELNLESHAFIQYEHVTPAHFQAVADSGFSPLFATGFLVLGAALVLVLEFVAKNNTVNKV